MTSWVKLSVNQVYVTRQHRRSTKWYLCVTISKYNATIYNLIIMIPMHVFTIGRQKDPNGYRKISSGHLWVIMWSNTRTPSRCCISSVAVCTRQYTLRSTRLQYLLGSQVLFPKFLRIRLIILKILLMKVHLYPMIVGLSLYWCNY